jgi:DNA invertase Pin-like site-specific DNA recombinase
MLRIGYVRLRDANSAEDTATLKAAGCHVVRAEEHGGELTTLSSILDFIGAGDQLVVTRLQHVAPSSRGALEILGRLEDHGASLHILESDLCSCGESGRALRAALQAVAAVEPAPLPRRKPAAAQEIHALQRAGVGPVEIARRLGVSRMTVWRKLRSASASA